MKIVGLFILGCVISYILFLLGIIGLIIGIGVFIGLFLKLCIDIHQIKMKLAPPPQMIVERE